MSLYPSSMQHILPRGEKHLARHRGQSYTSLYIINEPILYPCKDNILFHIKQRGLRFILYINII